MNETMQIYTRKDLELFRDRINNGERTLNAVLENDIDLSGENWIPIGVSETFDTEGRHYSFKYVDYGGNFDGNGHTISGMFIDGYETGYESGFFMSLNGGTIQNLTVGGEIRTKVTTGCLVGSMTDGRIINCNNYVKCSSELVAAGICGSCERGEIINCVNYADITGYNSVGIAGGYTTRRRDWNLIIKNCRNEGNLFVLIKYHSPVEPEISNENHGRYNQICLKIKPDSSNKQNGQVFFKDNNSLFGMYMYNYDFIAHEDISSDSFSQVFFELLKKDQDPEYTNELGETYLHLLCRNPTVILTDAITQKFKDMILMLASETKIDFAAKNNDGKEAIAFLKDPKTGRTKNGFAKIVKLIEEVKKDKDRLGAEHEEETFSDIGW